MARKPDMQAVLSRAVIADGWRKRVHDATAPVIKRQVRQAVLEVESGKHDFGKFKEQWESHFYEALRKLALKMAVDGYRLGEAELGSRAARKELKIQAIFGKADVDDGDAFLSDELIRRRVEPDVEAYLNRVAKKMSQTTIDDVTGVWKATVTENGTIREIADALLAKIDDWSQSRADNNARTLSIWAYNTGAVKSYEAAGIDRWDWLATDDDLTCLRCSELADGGPYEMGEPVPPEASHPLCRCSASAHFAEPESEAADMPQRGIRAKSLDLSGLNPLLDQAERGDDKAESRLREMAAGVKGAVKLPLGEVPDSYRHVIKAFAVDGDSIKLARKMDFVEGGNDRAYPWMPKAEVWVDADVDPHDWHAILRHELTERDLMANHGLKYEAAHKRANEIEREERAWVTMPNGRRVMTGSRRAATPPHRMTVGGGA